MADPTKITLQVASLTGITPTYEAANTDGDYWENSGREIIHIKNGHSSPWTVTVHSQALCNQGVEHDVAVVVTNAQERIIGPFPKGRFDDSNGRAQITYSGVTALTIAVITV